MSVDDEKLGNNALKIGDVTVGGRAFLAPMAGVTDIGMRRIARRFGASLVVSEMVAADDFARGDAESRLRAEGEGVDPHVVQIAGCDPRWMSEAARLAEASGAAIVDINMGGPAKKVTGGLAGSALMREPDLALELVRATVAAVKIPVTLKMRLGWDHASLNAPELAARAQAEGVAMVTVHGRTRQQFYKGRADWAAIRAVRERVTIPLVANGDCASPQDAAEMLRQSGADAAMIGRAAVGRPWLVGDVAHYLSHAVERPALPAHVRLAAALEHYETLLSAFGVAQGLRHARKHLAAYVEYSCRLAGAPVDVEARLRIVTSDDPAAVRAMLRDVFLSREAEAA